MRQVLHVPANPGGQRPVLVILVHGGEVPPLRISAQNLDHAGFKVDAKPLPLQQEQTGSRNRMPPSEAGTKAGRRKEPGDESSLEQHAIRLVAGKILRRAYEG